MVFFTNEVKKRKEKKKKPHAVNSVFFRKRNVSYYIHRNINQLIYF